MKTFKNQSAKEQGIDTSRQFVVVDELSDGSGYKKGDILEINRDDNSRNPYFKRISDGVEHCWDWSRLYYATKDWDTLEAGDTLINFDDEVEVLGICGKVIFTGDIDDNSVVSEKGGETKEQLIDNSWKIKGIETEEDMVEVECEGNKVKISRKSAENLNLIK